MKLIFLCIFLIVSQSSYCQTKSILSEIEINPQASHQFINLMILDLIELPNKIYNDREFLEDLIVINENLKGQPPEAIKTFMLSELYKILFNFEQSKLVDVDNIYISSSNLDLAEEKLRNNSKLLTKFSNFLMSDMIENFAPFKKDNYINNYLNTALDQSKVDPSKKKKIMLLNKHVGPWIIIFNQFSSKQFKFFGQGYIKHYFKTIKHLSKFFKFQKFTTVEIDIFRSKDGTISDLIAKLDEQKANQVIKEEPQENKVDTAKKDVENITVEPADAADGKIDEIIKNLDQKKP